MTDLPKCKICSTLIGMDEREFNDGKHYKCVKWTPSNELIATMAATFFATGGVTAQGSINAAKEICRLINESNPT